jgi:hypothetical protein
MKRKRGKHRENFPCGWCQIVGETLIVILIAWSSTRCKSLPLVSLRRMRSFHATS